MYNLLSLIQLKGFWLYQISRYFCCRTFYRSCGIYSRYLCGCILSPVVEGFSVEITAVELSSVVDESSADISDFSSVVEGSSVDISVLVLSLVVEGFSVDITVVVLCSVIEGSSQLKLYKTFLCCWSAGYNIKKKKKISSYILTISINHNEVHSIFLRLPTLNHHFPCKSYIHLNKNYFNSYFTSKKNKITEYKIEKRCNISTYLKKKKKIISII